MHALFSLERTRNAASRTREREEREAQLAKMHALEVDIAAQREHAHAHPPEPRVRGVPLGEVHELHEAHAAAVARLKEAHAAAVAQLKEAHAATEARLKDAHAAAEARAEAAEARGAALADALARAEGALDGAQRELAALRAHVERAAEQRTSGAERVAALDAQLGAERARSAALAEQVAAGERLRRRLHNEVQELRGNVRVYVRVRPARGGGAEAALAYPDALGHTALEVHTSAESATGAPVHKTYPFAFDRVFGPDATQGEVFDEVAQLVQSVLDGYNTTIFAYGQTGSGKTHTLEGPDVPDAASAGLIPRAMAMLWDVAERLGAQGWTYSFDAQMLQIYLDHIYDLLGDGDERVRHEIRHDADRTVVTHAVSVPLDGPTHVLRLLARAKKRRAVAATLQNERSSRSHSVFMVRVRGQSARGESCDATLNLVDLAGSERLATSGSAADPARLREAQSINRSLSSLGDVIAALGTGRHVPYRNSTLTWLLRNSLGGNTKTLMLLALSPLAEHLGETLCSLRFASKVHATHIGTARAVRS